MAQRGRGTLARSVDKPAGTRISSPRTLYSRGSTRFQWVPAGDGRRTTEWLLRRSFTRLPPENVPLFPGRDVFAHHPVDFVRGGGARPPGSTGLFGLDMLGVVTQFATPCGIQREPLPRTLVQSLDSRRGIFPDRWTRPSCCTPCGNTTGIWP